MTINKKYIRAAFFLSFILILFLVGLFIYDKEEKTLRERYALSYCSVRQCEARRGVILLYYDFTVKAKLKSGTTRLFVDKVSLDVLRKIYLDKRNFVVAYDTLDVSNNRLLLTPKDYREFKVTPDDYVLKIFELLKPYQIGNGW